MLEEKHLQFERLIDKPHINQISVEDALDQFEILFNEYRKENQFSHKEFEKKVNAFLKEMRLRTSRNNSLQTLKSILKKCIENSFLKKLLASMPRLSISLEKNKHLRTYQNHDYKIYLAQGHCIECNLSIQQQIKINPPFFWIFKKHRVLHQRISIVDIRLWNDKNEEYIFPLIEQLILIVQAIRKNILIKTK